MHGTTEDRTLLPEHRAEIAELCAFLDRTPQAVGKPCCAAPTALRTRCPRRSTRL